MTNILKKPRRVSGLVLLILGCLLLVTTVTLAATGALDLSWWTVDGGGGISSSGGGFDLAGAIGQPDAGPGMSGGSFQLAGGFWTGSVPSIVPSLFLPVIQR